MAYYKRNTTQHDLDVIQSNTLAKSAEILGISMTTIHNICRDNGITFIRQRGMPNREKYAEKKRIKIDFKEGMTIAEIAKKYALRPTDVRLMLNQTTYGPVFKHIPENAIEWLDLNRPKDMSIYEYAAIIIREVYEEETQ